MQDYFIAFLPWIFLAGFMFFMLSQVRSNGNQIMQFGKSKAKELDEESPKITFKDVAGAEEAKEELEEIKEFLKSFYKFLFVFKYISLKNFVYYKLGLSFELKNINFNSYIKAMPI